jgi:uncharacterized membrane protein
VDVDPRCDCEPGTMAVWGLIVAGGLAIGLIPAFIGLIIVMPVLGHATSICIARCCRDPAVL